MSAKHSTTLEEARRAIDAAVHLLRRSEQEQKERSRNGSPRDFVEQLRHVLDGGLSDEQHREYLDTARVLLMKLVADDALRTGGSK